MQPEDIYAFGTQYFTELLAVNGIEGKDASQRTPPSTAHVNQSRQHTPQQDQQQQSQQGGQDARVSAFDITEMSPQEVESLIMGASLSQADLAWCILQAHKFIMQHICKLTSKQGAQVDLGIFMWMCGSRCPHPAVC
uniref:RIIa domain-containing protein n=1 Tax=Dunaliella tertiolecta TaxID=3047 RepID=A0A7S3QRZ3_DUNTE